MKKDIILLTHYFPFGKKESFLATEIEHISTAFEKVHIFNVGIQINKSEKRLIPKNCIIYNTNHQNSFKNRFTALYSLFSIHFYVELFYLVFIYKKTPNLNRIKTILISLRNSKAIKHSIENQIDLSKSNLTIYSYWSDDNATAIAMLAKKYPQHKYISRAHGWDLYFERSVCDYLAFKKLIIKYLDEIHFISNDGLKYFRKKHNLPNQDKLFVSRLGVKGHLVEIDSFYKKDKPFTILSNSYIYPNKRVDLIAEVVSKLDGDINWCHIGDAAYDDEHFEKLKRFTERLLKDKKTINYTLLGGISNFDVTEILKTNKIDLFVNLSLSEGIPVTFMEVMSFGIPVLATNVGGVNEIINQTNGVLIDKGLEAERIAKIISEFWSKNEFEIQQYRVNAFNQWGNKYNADHNYLNFTKHII